MASSAAAAVPADAARTGRPAGAGEAPARPAKAQGGALAYPKAVVPGRQYLVAVATTFAGFVVAILVNLLWPQVASVPAESYQLGALTVDRNGFYRLVVLGVIALYAVGAVVDWIVKDRRAFFAHRAAFRLFIGLLLALWDILGTKYQVLTQPFFPGPSQILEAFLMDGPYLLVNTLYSLRLFAAGFSCGVVLGVVTGILIGVFPRVYYWVFPFLKMTGIIPAVAWMPFALTLMPTPFVAATFIITISVWFPIAFGTASGIQGTPRMYFEAARTLGARTGFRVWHVAVPNALPNILTGITTATANAFVMLIISEMMGQPGGLGYYINAAKVWSSYYKVFAAILVMAILFSLIAKFVSLVRGYVLRWQKGVLLS